MVATPFFSVEIPRQSDKSDLPIEVRNSAAASKDPLERDQAIASIRELQNEAFDLLVHEKLAADESFRIFITLSNDVLRQLGTAGMDHHLSDS